MKFDEEMNQKRKSVKTIKQVSRKKSFILIVKYIFFTMHT